MSCTWTSLSVTVSHELLLFQTIHARSTAVALSSSTNLRVYSMSIMTLRSYFFSQPLCFFERKRFKTIFLKEGQIILYLIKGTVFPSFRAHSDIDLNFGIFQLVCFLEILNCFLFSFHFFSKCINFKPKFFLQTINFTLKSSLYFFMIKVRVFDDLAMTNLVW